MPKQRKWNAPGQGRQPTIAPAGQVARITARVSEQQRAEYIRRGASQALRDWLDGIILAVGSRGEDGASQALRDWLDGKLAAADNSNQVAHNASSDTEKGD